MTKKEKNVYEKMRVNFKNIRCDFFAGRRELVDTLGEYQQARYAIVDKKLQYEEVAKSEAIKLKVMIEGKDYEDVSKTRHYTKEELKAQQEHIEALQEAQREAVREIEERTNEARALISKELYEKYASGQFEEGIKEWFNAQGIEGVKPSVIKYFMVGVGYRNASARMTYSTGYLTALKGKRAFVTMFLNLLTDLALSKGVLNRDCYKWEYTLAEDNK